MPLRITVITNRRPRKRREEVCLREQRHLVEAAVPELRNKTGDLQVRMIRETTDRQAIVKRLLPVDRDRPVRRKRLRPPLDATGLPRQPSASVTIGDPQRTVQWLATDRGRRQWVETGQVIEAVRTRTRMVLEADRRQEIKGRRLISGDREILTDPHLLENLQTVTGPPFLRMVGGQAGKNEPIFNHYKHTGFLTHEFVYLPWF